MILFSILIPTIPSRMAMLLSLFDKLQRQATKEVEILCFLDNKQRSVGLKRDALVQSAKGRMMAFVDDDDDIADDYCEKILDEIHREPNADVITFPTICKVNEGDPVTIRHGIELDNTEWDAPNPTRKPWMCHPWRKELAQSSRFPDTSYGEDRGWLEKIWPFVPPYRQSMIDAPLYRYTYNSAVSEARP